MSDKKTQLNSAEYNLWYSFAQESVKYDDANKNPRGCYWFWGIYLLSTKIKNFPKFDIEAIQNKLPHEHWLKEIDPTLPEIIKDTLLDIEVFVKLYKNFKKTEDAKKIDCIDFSKLAFEEHHNKIAVNFSNFIFPINVFFTETRFSEPVNFSNACFFERSDFQHVKFLKGAFFYNATFYYDTNFNDTTFKEIAVFTGTAFYDFALFSRIDLASANFIGAHFKNRVPHFYDAKMGADIVWDKNSKLWPQIDWSNTNDDYKEQMGDSQNAYENLASHMKKLDKYHDEHFFYRQEMRCRRRLASYKTRFFYMLYEWLSDYGYGVEPAFRAWRWHMYVGAGIIAILSLINSWLECWKGGTWEIAENMVCSAFISFSNAHGFLSLHKGALSGCYTDLKHLVGFNAIWLFQTIFGIIFLFLFLLTLRIRFRLK